MSAAEKQMATDIVIAYLSYKAATAAAAKEVPQPLAPDEIGVYFNIIYQRINDA